MVGIRSIGAGVKRIEARVGVAAQVFARQREEDAAAAIARAARLEDEKQRAGSKEEAKPVFEIDASQGLTVSSFGLNVDFASLKLAAHKLRKTRPDRTHVALSEASDGSVFVVVAGLEKNPAPVDARAILRKAGATGGGTQAFAAGAAKATSAKSVMEKILK